MQQVFSTAKEYLNKKRLLLPLAFAALFLVLVHVIWGKATPRRIMYLNLAFYLFIIVYYFRAFQEQELLKGVKNVRSFLAIAFLSLCGLHLAYVARVFLIRFSFETWHENGMIDQYVTESYLSFLLYSVIMLILMPVGEELFFRYALVSFSSKKATALTVIFSLLLYVAMNADHPSGFLTLTVPAIVLTVAYLLTKNIYLTIIVHVIYSIVLNGEFIGYAFVRMLYR